MRIFIQNSELIDRRRYKDPCIYGKSNKKQNDTIIMNSHKGVLVVISSGALLAPVEDEDGCDNDGDDDEDVDDEEEELKD